MAAFFEIPLSPTPQRLRTTLNGQTYSLTFVYRGTPDGLGGWVMDVADTSGNAIAAGVPLVTGADLLGQLQYLGFGGGMAIGTDGNGDDPPNFTDLGITSHLYYVLYGGTQATATVIPGQRVAQPLTDSAGNPLVDSAGNPLFTLS